MRLAIASILACVVGGASESHPHPSTSHYQIPTRAPPVPTPPVITITAREYAFDGPDSIESGPTTFRLVSKGHMEHFLGLVKIASPHTFADYQGALSGQAPPTWVTAIGGVGTIPPGGVAMTTLDLAPGLYAMMCDMQGADGLPHMVKGMVRRLTVLSRANGAVMPRSDFTITLTEFAFGAPADVSPGPHVISVRNVGTQPHMVLVWQLHPGSSVSKAIHWMNTPSDSSDPITLLGGVPDLAPGHEAQLVLRLEPGHYMLICLVEDPRDHKSHYDKGMIREFAVDSGAGQ